MMKLFPSVARTQRMPTQSTAECRTALEQRATARIDCAVITTFPPSRYWQSICCVSLSTRHFINTAHCRGEAGVQQADEKEIVRRGVGIGVARESQLEGDQTVPHATANVAGICIPLCLIRFPQ